MPEINRDTAKLLQSVPASTDVGQTLRLQSSKFEGLVAVSFRDLLGSFINGMGPAAFSFAEYLQGIISGQIPISLGPRDFQMADVAIMNYKNVTGISLEQTEVPQFNRQYKEMFTASAAVIGQRLSSGEFTPQQAANALDFQISALTRASRGQLWD